MSATNPLYVLAITSPAFILIALGYASLKFSWLPKSGVHALGWFVTRIALPAAIFQALSSRSVHDILHFDYLIIYASGSLLTFFLVFGVKQSLQKKALTEASFAGLGASMSNTMLIGYPIIVALFGSAALVPIALTLIVENLLILPLGLALADTGQSTKSRFGVALAHATYGLLKNPIFIAIVAGILFSALSVSLPNILNTVTSSLASTVSGLAQFTVGAILADAASRLKHTHVRRDISLVLASKLFLHPAAIILIILLMPPLDPMFASVAIILACMPMFSIYAVLGMDYKLGEFCSATLLATTITSFITINLAIWIVRTQYVLS